MINIIFSGKSDIFLYMLLSQIQKLTQLVLDLNFFLLFFVYHSASFLQSHTPCLNILFYFCFFVPILNRILGKIHLLAYPIKQSRILEIGCIHKIFFLFWFFCQLFLLLCISGILYSKYLGSSSIDSVYLHSGNFEQA